MGKNTGLLEELAQELKDFKPPKDMGKVFMPVAKGDTLIGSIARDSELKKLCAFYISLREAVEEERKRLKRDYDESKVMPSNKAILGITIKELKMGTANDFLRASLYKKFLAACADEETGDLADLVIREKWQVVIPKPIPSPGSAIVIFCPSSGNGGPDDRSRTKH